MGPALAAIPCGGHCHPRGCDINPVGRLGIFQYPHISKCGQGLHSTLYLQHTFCQSVRFILGWWLGFFHPMLEDLCVCQGLLWLHQLKVIAAKFHILEGQELITVQGMWHWWCGVIIIHFCCVTSCFGNLKGSPYLPGEFSDVILVRNFSEFPPPGQHVKLPCMPADPLSASLGGGSGVRAS